MGISPSTSTPFDASFQVKSSMGDITKIAEHYTKEEGVWGDWPYPTVTIISKVTGELRDKILALTGGEGDVYLEESEISVGYSEYTQDTEYTIRVVVNASEVWKHDCEVSKESAMASFLRWVQ